MKSLGLPAEDVKPVLKKLLMLYNKKWELIEEDNYRTLADAIFELADDKIKVEQKGLIIKEDVEPPYKKPHIGLPEDQIPSSLNRGKGIMELEGESQKSSSSGGINAFTKDPSNNPHDPARNESIRNKSKNLIQVDSANVKKSSYAEGESGAHDANPKSRLPGLHSRKQRIKNGCETKISVEPGEKQLIDFPPRYSGATSNVRQGLIEVPQHSHMLKLSKGSGTPSSHETKFQCTHRIASSSCGHVHLSLKCDHVREPYNFRGTNSDELLRFVERKYKKLYKNVGPTFSLEKLLNEICESYKEMGDDSVDGVHRHQEIVETDRPERNMGNRSSGSDSHYLPRQPMDYGAKKRAVLKVLDITKGTEKTKISLYDDIGNEDPTSFVYIPENIIYQSGYVHVSLARIANEECCPSCTGDCLSSSIPCACAGDTGGEFAYTPGGLLQQKFLRSCISMNQEPQNQHLFYCQDCPLERAKNANRPKKCKGHLLRKFIKECWRKCGCSMDCGNRVVQRGITRKLEVFLTSKGKGWAVRALEELPEGAFVCEYVGEILTNMELYERNKQSSGKDKHVYPVLLDADWATEGVLKDEDALCLDATYYGNVARFINHRCFDSNLLEIPVQVETPDRHYYHIAFFTKRKVNALEELTWDYGIDFADHNHPIKAFKCLCGSELCRDKKR
ncbi:histone-lysine N-methyltransferase SUVR1 [Dorcoceras hygrometricum]|uniref:Histone-lysine N-methyltransferase SUVR1 n=1 Tax=Dorcoceras hygrometricum TaxID=472368 RepID=A0A2Z7AQT7_9LAMI|nr:histone-lysine N-methyltransferase SUVR1 [Dorcoceras hygrometricum]